MSTISEKNTVVYRTSFLKYFEKNESFLKQGVDLHFLHAGKKLEDLVSLPLGEVDGVLFDDFILKPLADIIYSRIKGVKKEPLKIKNNKLTLFLYTQCQIDGLILFFVWQFVTENLNQSKSSWEKKYGMLPNFCCKKNYISQYLKSHAGENIDINSLVLQIQSTDLDQVIENNCKYKEGYVECKPFVYTHLFNKKTEEGGENFAKIEIQLTNNAHL